MLTRGNLGVCICVHVWLSSPYRNVGGSCVLEQGKKRDRACGKGGGAILLKSDDTLKKDNL